MTIDDLRQFGTVSIREYDDDNLSGIGLEIVTPDGKVHRNAVVSKNIGTDAPIQYFGKDNPGAISLLASWAKRVQRDGYDNAPV